MEIFTLDVGYQTGTGNKMPITVHGIYIPRVDIPTNDNPGKYCATEHINCKGFSGGCPPYAPRFSKLKRSIENVYVICVEYDMANSLQFAGWRKGKSAPGMFILMYADRMTMCYVKRALKHFNALNYYTLGAGNCSGCRPVDCIVTQGQKCVKPKKRTFSVESTGIDCGRLHDQIFGDVLPWWFHTKAYTPARMYRYALVYTDTAVMDQLLWDFVTEDKSYCEDVLRYSYVYVKSTLVVPEGRPGAGRMYPAYEIPLEEMVK